LGFLVNMTRWMAEIRSSPVKDPLNYWEITALPFNISAGLMMGTLILMSVFYSADALYGERRERSVLFWKSLPVSDLTTVLAKPSIPLVILPLLTFAITIGLQLITLLLSSVVLLANGMSVAPLWRELSIFQMWGAVALPHFFGPCALAFTRVLLAAAGLRVGAPGNIVWAALPVVAISGLEKLVFHTWHFAALVGTRLIGGGAPTDFTSGQMFPTGPMTHITPGRYFSAPGLWIGLAVAVVFLAAAVRLRRYRDPV
jgi:ABC-2 type transport system permease protein